MAEIKTKVHDGDVFAFIDSFAQTEQRRKDAIEMVKIMQEASGFPPKMWGASIIGFGVYHYKSERSRQEGDWPMVGFSPRKNALTLYVYSGTKDQHEMLASLGKYTMGKSCIYVKKLSDIHIDVLVQLIQISIAYLRKKYPDTAAFEEPGN